MTDPRIPPGLLGHRSNRGRRGEGGGEPPAARDPLGWCVIATTALLTWLIGPAALLVLASLGFARYWRAWRAGRTDSTCILRDMRLVLGYLAVLAIIGAIGLGLDIAGRL